VYKGGSWTDLLVRAGLLAPPSELESSACARLGSLLHIDEPTRLRALGRTLDATSSLSVRERRWLAMLDFQLHHRGVLRTAEETIEYFAARPRAQRELLELSDALAERIATADDVYPVSEWPLALHRHYGRREIMAAVGYVEPGKKGKTPQGGIVKLEADKRELLLVTLDKSGKSFSPTTRYRDYAISPTLFHWETQSAASSSRPSGRRYIESPGNGWSFYLFVRTDPDAAYAFAGPARHVSHTGDRPIAITWVLQHALPAGLYQEYATLAEG
jgi:hypothetical protein